MVTLVKHELNGIFDAENTEKTVNHIQNNHFKPEKIYTKHAGRWN